MASLLFDQAAKTFYVRFRYGGRSFKRSLETANSKLARGQLARVEEMLLLLRRGRLTVPPAADPAVFILSDGKLLQDSESKLVTLAELTAAFATTIAAQHSRAANSALVLALLCLRTLIFARFRAISAAGCNSSAVGRRRWHRGPMAP